ncbi:hypothetical protein HGRIS_014543 [Hohenbuehelia grisea]|uniref:F-box domain-containing protein n=1 Tax=Hohenbuehelia grisea TaxID=104357 RepID=A0ABR3JUR8_9AGAR
MPTTITCRRLDAVAARVGSQKVLYVPHDIWLYIASFLPIRAVRNLYSVNSSFFDIAMDARYRQVDLCGGLDRVMSRKLDHMKDQHVSTRIRCLHIRPWHIDDIEPPKPGYFSRIRKKIKRMVDPEFPELEAKQLVQRRVQTELKVIMDVVKTIKDGVTEYFIEWDEQPLYHALFFSTLLHPLLRHVAHNLRKLTIKVPVERFRALIPSERKSQPVVLKNLRELRITLFTGSLPKKEIDENLEVLILFMHNVASTLQTLSITTTHNSANLDLSRFFHLLGKFPRLRHFSLSIPADGAHLSDVSSLKEFLFEHTLRSLSLTTLPSTSGVVQHYDAQEPCWIPKTLKDAHFEELDTLTVSLIDFRRAREPTLRFLRSFAPNLTTLVLVDHLLTFEEVQHVLGPSVFRGMSRLERLAFSMTNFGPALMDFVVHTHPRLERLDVVFDHLSHGFHLDIFVMAMESRMYTECLISQVGLQLYSRARRALLPRNAAERLSGAFQACLPQFDELTFV